MTVKYNIEAHYTKVNELYEKANMLKAKEIKEFVKVHNTDDEFEHNLNKAYGGIDICGHNYLPGSVLREINKVAFREDKLEAADEMCRNTDDELVKDDFSAQALIELDMKGP